MLTVVHAQKVCGGFFFWRFLLGHSKKKRGKFPIQVVSAAAVVKVEDVQTAPVVVLIELSV